MLKILQARLKQYVNRGFLDVQAGFRKGRETRDQIANIRWILEKAREFLLLLLLITPKFLTMEHNTLWKTVQEMGIPDHLTCLLRNLYVGQEANLYAGPVRTGHRSTD